MPFQRDELIHVAFSVREARSLIHATELLRDLYRFGGLEEELHGSPLELAGQKLAHRLEVGEKVAR